MKKTELPTPGMFQSIDWFTIIIIVAMFTLTFCV